MSHAMAYVGDHSVVEALMHQGVIRRSLRRELEEDTLAVVYRQMFREAMTLSYIDVLWLLGVGTMSMLPLLFLLRKSVLGGKAQMGH